MSRRKGQRKKRRKANPPLPPGWARPRPALMALLAEQGVTEADWRRIQKARVIVNDVNDRLAARGSGVMYVVMQAVTQACGEDAED